MAKYKNINENKVLDIIKSKNYTISPEDISVELNVSLLEIKTVLNRLAFKYGSKIFVSDNGNLIYKFPANFKNQNTSNPFEIFIYMISFIYEIFSFIFKISIMFFMVFFAVVYLTIIFIILFFEYISPKRRTSMGFVTETDDDEMERKEEIKDFMNDVIGIFTFFDNEKSIKPLYVKLFSFVFGESEKHSISFERTILLFINEHKKITLSDIFNLTGFNESDSQKIILDLVVKYEGDIKVTENGVIYYSFENLSIRKLDKLKNKKYTYIWNNDDIKPIMNNNTNKDNGIITLINIINLLMSGFVYSGEYFKSPFIIKYFGLYPLIFSVIFFLIPTVRYFLNSKKIEKFNFNKKIYNLFNDFAYNIKLNTFNKQLENNCELYLTQNYPEYFKIDYSEDEKVINLLKYKEEIRFSSGNKPKTININNPDDSDFMDF